MQLVYPCGQHAPYHPAPCMLCMDFEGRGKPTPRSHTVLAFLYSPMTSEPR